MWGPWAAVLAFLSSPRASLTNKAIRLVQDSFAFIAQYDGPIPGTTEPECGNYWERDLPGARAEAAAMIPILEHWDEGKLQYEAFLDEIPHSFLRSSSALFSRAGGLFSVSPPITEVSSPRKISPIPGPGAKPAAISSLPETASCPRE